MTTRETQTVTSKVLTFGSRSYEVEVERTGLADPRRFHCSGPCRTPRGLRKTTPHRVFTATLNGTPGWVECVCRRCQHTRYAYEGAPVPDQAIVDAMLMSGDMVLHHLALAFRAGTDQDQRRIKWTFDTEWLEYATKLLLTSHRSRAQKPHPFHLVGKQISARPE